jgi:hypothetical protein
MKEERLRLLSSHPDLAKFGLAIVASRRLTRRRGQPRSRFRVSIVTVISRRFGSIVQHDGSQVQLIT